MYVWPFSLDKYRWKVPKHPKYISVQQFVFDEIVMNFHFSSINIEVSGYGGANKCCVFAGTYFHVRIICMCFIERIRFYVHGKRVLFVRIHPNCELWRFYGYMYECPGSKNPQFLRGFPGPCTPHTKEQKWTRNQYQMSIWRDFVEGSPNVEVGVPKCRNSTPGAPGTTKYDQIQQNTTKYGQIRPNTSFPCM